MLCELEPLLVGLLLCSQLLLQLLRMPGCITQTALQVPLLVREHLLARPRVTLELLQARLVLNPGPIGLHLGLL